MASKTAADEDLVSILESRSDEVITFKKQEQKGPVSMVTLSAGGQEISRAAIGNLIVALGRVRNTLRVKIEDGTEIKLTRKNRWEFENRLLEYAGVICE